MALDVVDLIAAGFALVAAWHLRYEQRVVAVCFVGLALLMLISIWARHVSPYCQHGVATELRSLR